MTIKSGMIFEWVGFNGDDECENGQCVGVITKVIDGVITPGRAPLVMVKWWEVCPHHSNRIDLFGPYTIDHLWEI